MKRGDLRIGARLALGFGPLLVLLVLVAVIGLGRLAALNARFTAIVVERHGKSDLLHAVVDESHRMALAAQHLLIAADPAQAREELATIARARHGMGALLERLDHAFRGEGERAKSLQAAAHGKLSAYLVGVARCTRLFESGRVEEARALLGARLHAELGAALAALRDLRALQTRAVREGVAEAAASYRGARDLIAGLALACAALGALIAFATARAIAGPLEEAVQVATRVAAGDLAQRIGAQGASETGRVMAALARMNASLGRIVGEVRGGSDTIATAARQLVGANDELSGRTQQHAAALEEAASAMEQFAAAAAQNAANARLAAQLAGAVSDTAARGGQSVGRVVAAMGAIQSSASSIGEVVALMDDLAFQINLLALNAAVEAAHAGEHGRGFAAVAAEVRALSLRSAAAAAQVKSLVGAAVGRIAQGASQADEAGGKVQEILDGASRVAAIMGDISAATEQQRSGIGHVNQALAGMDRMTQENAALVEQVAASMRVLEGEARHLVETVRVFDLGDAAPAAPAEVVVEPAPARRRLRLRAERGGLPA